MITNYYDSDTENTTFKEFIDKVLGSGQQIQNVIVVSKQISAGYEIIYEAIVLATRPL